MKKLAFVLALLVSTILSAQVPGYMGRKLLVSLTISPNVSFPFDSYDEYEGGGGTKFKVKPRFSGIVEYVYNRRRSIGFKYSYLKTTGLNIPIFYKIPGIAYPFTVGGYAPASVSAHSIGLRYIKYTSGNLPAPLGRYWGVYGGVGIATFNDIKGAFLNIDGKEKGPYMTRVLPDINFFIGTRRGIGKFLMYSLNIEFNVAALSYVVFNSDFDPYLTSTPWGGTYSSDISYKPAGYFQNSVNRDATGKAYYYSNLLGVSLELTLLPF